MKCGLFQTCKAGLFFKNVDFLKKYWCKLYYQTIDKNHIIVSIYIDRAYDKVPHVFMIKSLSKLEMGGTFLTWWSASTKTPVANITPNCERMNVIPIRAEIRQGHSFSALLVNTTLDILDRTIRQRRK